MRQVYVKVDSANRIIYVAEKINEEYIVKDAILIETEIEDIELLNYKLENGQLINLTDDEKQIDICPPKSNEELQEEIEMLKSQLDEIHERLCTQQEMSSTVMQHIFTEEAENE